MEHLSKHQIVLVALLVSFVTALATGVVTVSLMSQAPESVTQTISRVIERTIDVASPQAASVSMVTSREDALSLGVMRIASSTVFIKDVDVNNIVGTGLILTTTGIVATDRSIFKDAHKYSLILPDSTEIPFVMIPGTDDSDIVLLTPFSQGKTDRKNFIAVQVSSKIRLGESVYTISGTKSPILEQGIISALPIDDNPLSTSFDDKDISAGRALFDIDGMAVGIRSVSSKQFYLADKIIKSLSDRHLLVN